MALMMRGRLDGDSVSAADGDSGLRDGAGGDASEPAGRGARFAVPLEQAIALGEELPRELLQIAMRAIGANGTGECPRLEIGTRSAVGGEIQAVLGGVQRFAKQKVGHHQPMADGVESIVQFVRGKLASRIVACPACDAVAIAILKFHHDVRPEIGGAFQIEKVAECVAQLQPIETPHHRSAPGGFQSRVRRLQFSGQQANRGGKFHWLRPLLASGRHGAGVQLIDDSLPSGQRIRMREIEAEIVETQIVRLPHRPVAFLAVTAQKRPELLERLRRRIGSRGGNLRRAERMWQHLRMR